MDRNTRPGGARSPHVYDARTRSEILTDQDKAAGVALQVDASSY